jgi:hypothetical protein
MLKMPDVELPTIDLSEIDIPKVDVGKAIADAVTATGLGTRRRSRWPYVLGAGLVVVVAGWAAMNSAAIRDRLGRAKSWIGDQVGAMPAQDDLPEQADVSDTVWLEQPVPPASVMPGEDHVADDDDLRRTSETVATNGRSTAASRR